MIAINDRVNTELGPGRVTGVCKDADFDFYWVIVKFDYPYVVGGQSNYIRTHGEFRESKVMKLK